MEKWMYRETQWTDRLTDGWKEGWKEGWNGRKDEQ